MCHGSLGGLVLQAPLGKRGGFTGEPNNNQSEPCFPSSFAKGKEWNLEEKKSGSISKEAEQIVKKQSRKVRLKKKGLGA